MIDLRQSKKKIALLSLAENIQSTFTDFKVSPEKTFISVNWAYWSNTLQLRVMEVTSEYMPHLFLLVAEYMHTDSNGKRFMSEYEFCDTFVQVWRSSQFVTTLLRAISEGVSLSV